MSLSKRFIKQRSNLVNNVRVLAYRLRSKKKRCYALDGVLKAKLNTCTGSFANPTPVLDADSYLDVRAERVKNKKEIGRLLGIRFDPRKGRQLKARIKQFY